MVAWAPWNACSDGKRDRSEIVQVEPVGAGVQCPELRTEEEGLIDFIIDILYYYKNIENNV